MSASYKNYMALTANAFIPGGNFNKRHHMYAVLYDLSTNLVNKKEEVFWITHYHYIYLYNMMKTPMYKKNRIFIK